MSPHEALARFDGIRRAIRADERAAIAKLWTQGLSPASHTFAARQIREDVELNMRALGACEKALKDLICP